MSWSADDAFEALRADARALAQGATLNLPASLPAADLRRSPAAARTGRLAAASGLFAFHFEARHHLELPEHWAPEHAPELAQPPQWDGGVLPESKYQSFRHDLRVASFHPHHRAKWTAHELCHGLVGFAWQPNASAWFHATAGRLAELLPVALYYFFDEAFLRRCPEHAPDGPLFRGTCRRCEALAAPLPDHAEARRFLADGMRFVDRELAAIARSRRTGTLQPHRWATLDLCSDGVAYAAAHLSRLRSDCAHAWADRFLPHGPLDLDELEVRVLAVCGGLLGQHAPEPLAPSPIQGQARWTLQDLGWRLLQVREETEGEAADEISRIVDALAAHIPATSDPSTSPTQLQQAVDASVHTAWTRWRDLCEDYALPDAEDVFTLGYPLAGVPTSPHPLHEGLRGAFPEVSELLGVPALAEQASRAPWTREGLGRRVAGHLQRTQPGLAADLLAFDASLAAARGPSTFPLEPSGPDPRFRLAEHTLLLYGDAALPEAYDQLVEGTAELDLHEGALACTPMHAPTTPAAFLIGRSLDGTLHVATVEPSVAAALADPLGQGVPRLRAAEHLDLLAAAGLIEAVTHHTEDPPAA